MFPVTDRLHIRCSVPGEKNDLVSAAKSSKFPDQIAGRLEGHRLVGREMWSLNVAVGATIRRSRRLGRQASLPSEYFRV